MHLLTHASCNGWNLNLVVETQVRHQYEVSITAMTRSEDYWVITHHRQHLHEKNSGIPVKAVRRMQ
jgi:hypothetical protein